jgi:hypothetical protein
MNAVFLLAAALATSDAPAVEMDATVEDVTELQGTWEAVELKMGGMDLSATLNRDYWTFAGDTVKGRFGSMRIAAGTTRLDILDDVGGTCRSGDYRIKGDSLVWVWYLEDCPIRYKFRRASGVTP